MKNIDCILIQPGSLEIYNVTYLPFAPLFLATKIREAGFGVKIFDARMQHEKELWETLESNKVTLIGFFIITGPSISYALRLSEKIRKKYPDVKFVWGGPHPTILPEQTLKHSLVDIVGIGEGDLVMPDLLKALNEKKPLDHVKGIIFKKGRKLVRTSPNDFVNWDADVHYSFDLIDYKKYIFTYAGKKTIHMITSRGCPFHCSFCWNLLCNKKKWRAWSAKKIEQEIQPFLKAGIKRIILNDDFMGPESRVMEFGKMFHKHKLEWGLENGCRVDVHTSDEFFKTIKKYGCTHASYGAESGSQKFLDKINKGTKIEQIINIAEQANKYKVGLKYGWMMGMPNETKEDALKTVELIQKLHRINPKISQSISLFAPYPGTEMYEDAIKLGWKPPQKLTDWADFREEAGNEFLDDVWWYKSVILTNYFLFAINTEVALWKNPKGIFKVVTWVYKQSAKVRWKHRYFDLPYEYKFLQFGWSVYKRLKGWFG